jgi:PAS domain S-box-containing protein
MVEWFCSAPRRLAEPAADGRDVSLAPGRATGNDPNTLMQNTTLPLPAGGAEPARAKILLVDDQPANLLALEAVLGDLEPELVRATSGEEALRCLGKQDFAVVLLDVWMEGLNGFETARRIRAGERSRHTPIIFLTAYESPQLQVVEAYGLGAVDYLVKPLVPEIVRAKVATFIELFEEKQRARSQADLFRLLVQETADYAIFMLDPEGRVVTWNAGAERIKGYSAAEIVGQHFTRFYPQEAIDRGWPAEELRRATADGRIEDEGWRLRKDGSRFWANVVITALRDAAGRLVGFAKVTRDLTERRGREEALRRLHAELEQRVEERTAALSAANEALRQSEEQFRTLANSIPQLAWMARPDGHLFWYNQRWFDYTGQSAGQTEGWGWQAVHDPAELPRVLVGWRAALAAGTPWEDTFPLRRHDGQMRWHLSRALPVRDEEGRIVRWFGTNTDITDRIELEKALRDADRRKDEFLAMLAHELRNPLAPVLTGLHILRMAQADQATVERTRTMLERQIRHLTRLVDDLLEVSRITQGKLQVRRERLDLGAVVRTAAEDRRAFVEQSGMRLAVVTPAEPVWVAGDSVRLAQVLNNLLDNAVKFRDGGGGGVTIELSVDTKRREAVLRVEDQGIGIAPELFPRLFDVFAQADRSLDRSRGGLGIGLSVVKGLVNLHGGEVEASSGGPGRGAAFTIRLPLKDEREALTGLPAGPQEPAAEPLRILVVEDSRDAADSLRILLEFLGHQVRVAFSGHEGVQMARGWHPDVVLCDIGLPGLDGYGVAEELRHDPATANMQLIAVTGYGRDEDRRRARQAGFDHHLTKPVDPTVLRPLLIRPA